MDRIRKDLTLHAKSYSTDFSDIKQHFPSSSTMRSFAIAADVTQYILNDRKIKKNAELSRSATILSETAIVEGMHVYISKL